MATAAVQQPAPATPAQPTPADDWTVQLHNLQFSYPGCPKSLSDVSLDLPRGSRTLLLGANGAGKTTLLQLIAGKYMVGRDTIRVLAQSPFYDMVRAKRECVGGCVPSVSAWVGGRERECMVTYVGRVQSLVCVENVGCV